MIYETIKNNYRLCNSSEYKGRWFQRVVFVNKRDVLRFSILGQRISFVLRADKKGFHYEYSDKLLEVLGNFENVRKNNTFYFKHNVQIALGSLLNTRLLNELNKSEYFAALLDDKDNVFIFGFNYGLKPEENLYNSHLLNIVSVSSEESGLEINPPYLYYSLTPKEDFDEDFENNTFIDSGDFNDDFNDDFLI